MPIVSRTSSPTLRYCTSRLALSLSWPCLADASVQSPGRIDEVVGHVMEGRSANKAGHGQLTIRETNQILDDLAAAFRSSKAKKGKGADKPSSTQLAEDRIKVHTAKVKNIVDTCLYPP
jgi:hypothetical protein